MDGSITLGPELVGVIKGFLVTVAGVGIGYMAADFWYRHRNGR